MLFTVAYTSFILLSMWDLKKLKAKILSTKNITKITNALEIIATLKLQKTKKQTETMRDYIDVLLPMCRLINQQARLFWSSKSRDESEETSVTKALHIVVGTDKWLCWSINTTLLKDVQTQILPHKDVVSIYAVGQKIAQAMQRNWYSVMWVLQVPDVVTHDALLPLVQFLHESLERETYDTIVVHYNYFKNTMSYIPTHTQLFPLQESTRIESLRNNQVDWETQEAEKVIEYIIEPTMQDLLQTVRELMMRFVLYGAILQGKTSEFASRMLAMKSAKDNAINIVNDLTIAFNKARQDSITQEVLEIVSAKSVIESM